MNLIQRTGIFENYCDNAIFIINKKQSRLKAALNTALLWRENVRKITWSIIHGIFFFRTSQNITTDTTLNLYSIWCPQLPSANFRVPSIFGFDFKLIFLCSTIQWWSDAEIVCWGVDCVNRLSARRRSGATSFASLQVLLHCKSKTAPRRTDPVVSIKPNTFLIHSSNLLSVPWNQFLSKYWIQIGCVAVDSWISLSEIISTIDWCQIWQKT